MKFLGRSGIQVQLRQRTENKGMNSRICQILNYHLPASGSLLSAIDRALPRFQSLVPSASMRAQLYEFFAPHNEALFAFLGRNDIQTWDGPHVTGLRTSANDHGVGSRLPVGQDTTAVWREELRP